MGLIVKRNKNKQYKLISSISDKSLNQHEEWISEEEAKKTLIELAFYDFISKTIEIDMTFPNNYYVNGKCNNKKSNAEEFWKFILDSYKPGQEDVLEDKFQEIIKRLGVELK